MNRSSAKKDLEDMLLALAPAFGGSKASPVEHAAKRRASIALERALSHLSAEERVLLKMRFVDGCTVTQIAQTFRVDAKRFRRRFNRLLTRLHHHLAERAQWGSFEL